jgi:hypothetical protein
MGWLALIGIVFLLLILLRIIVWFFFSLLLRWILSGTFRAYDAAQATRKFRKDMAELVRLNAEEEQAKSRD